MIRKIGKYEIRDRIGRGGMGMVYRAHDPILDRAVALKVISDDVEVTEELRARFFLEAQACAKLNHPNIVTIYDMGEDDGRLFIVMEFLQGEELRHVIAQRRTMDLEDKVGLMIQICSGLHYAHQHGVIHRDIKPGNIIVLQQGVAKIVDFGIAHMSTAAGSLTRTGLLMGSLRYMSPEQARGQADHRSDMFSLGSVFYEFLSNRAAVVGQDPMHLLEQLRAVDPPPLAEVSPGVPASLAAVIARAMRKEPGERFADLAAMRAALEGVQAELGLRAAEARRRVGEKLERVRQLGAALAAEIGGDAPPVPSIDERAHLESLGRMDEELAAEAERLSGQATRAQAVSAAVARGLAHLAAARDDEAVRELERVVAEFPEHERAKRALAEASARAQRERQRADLASRLDEARGAFDRGSYRTCLGLLDAIAPGAAEDIEREIAGLRHAAETALAAQATAQREEASRQRARADGSAAILEETRRLAQDVEAPRRCSELWEAAEAKAAEARAAIADGAYALAVEVCEEATALYRRAEEAARDLLRLEELRRQQTLAAGARQQMAQQQKAGEAVEAARRAESLWQRATAKAREGEGALAQEVFLRAVEAFDAATALYRRAEEAAGDAIRKEETERQRAQADRARAAAAEAREAAVAVAARQRASSLWQAAQAREAAADAAFAQAAHEQSERLHREAAGLYGESATAARAVLEQEREQAERALAEALSWQEQATGAQAEAAAPALCAEAAAALSTARTALSAGDHVGARAQLADVQRLYRRAIQAAEDLRRRQRAEAAQRRDAAVARRAAAAEQEAASQAPDAWREAEAAMARGERGAAAEDHAAAAEAFAAAADAFGRAEQGAREAARRAERERAERARAAMEPARAAAVAVHAAAREPSGWASAEARATDAQRALDGERYADAAAAFDAAAKLFRETEEAARAAQRREEAARLRDLAERARQSMGAARMVAAEVAAERRAPPAWSRAAAKAAEAGSAMTRGDHAPAAALFDEAGELYREAERAAREIIRDEEARHHRQLAEQARDLMERRRGMAADAGAPASADPAWAAAETRRGEALRAFDGEQWTAAGQAFGAAGALYRDAADAARRAAARPAPAPAQAASSTQAPVADAPPEPADTPTVVAHERPSARAAAPDEATLLADPGGAGRPSAPDEPTERPDATVVAPSRDRAPRPKDRAAEERTVFAQPAAPKGGAAPADERADETMLREDRRSRPPAHAPREPAAGVDAPRPERGRPARKARPVAIAAGVAALAVVGVGGWLWSRPPAPPPAPRTQAPAGRPEEHTAVARLGEQATAARSDSVRAGADRLAAAILQGADDKRREADAALARRDVPAARQRYEEAIAAYEQAKSEATRVAAVRLKEDQDREEKARRDEHARREQDERDRRARDDQARKEQEEGERTAKAQAVQQSIAAARARVAEARRAAEQANAPRLAPPLWSKASASQQQAEEALRREAFPRAETGFADAERSYREAAQAAVATARRAADDLDQARRGAAKARQDAEQQAAPRLAAGAFQAAQQKAAEAEAAAKQQDPVTALARFREASDLYAQAGTQAGTESQRQLRAADQRQRADADQARDGAAEARRAAERAQAGRHAPKLVAAGQAKEKEADAALGRNDYPLAARLFGESRSEYAAAEHEAKQVQVAALRSSVDQGRAAAAERRREAQQAEAERLAKGLFDAAQAKLADAEALAGRQNLPGAAQAYQEAGDRFGEATRRAKAQQEARAGAEQSRKRMAGEKQAQGTFAEAPEFQAALARERQGAEHYQQASFKEAGEAWAAAADLYAKARRPAAAPPRPEPPRPSPADEIRAALDRYVRAFEAKDLPQLQKLRPGLSGDDVKALKQTFDLTREYRVSLKIDSLDVTGDEAVVVGQRQDRAVGKDGRPFNNDSRFTVRLKRTAGGWVIDTMK